MSRPGKSKASRGLQVRRHGLRSAGKLSPGKSSRGFQASRGLHVSGHGRLDSTDLIFFGSFGECQIVFQERVRRPKGLV